MKKVTPKQATIIVKGGISNMFRDLADKNIADKKNPIKNDIEYCLNVANVYSGTVDFAKDAYSKFSAMSKAYDKDEDVDAVAVAGKKDWPDLAKGILD